ncbi:MAG: hypothetical protein LBQ46_07115 [Treponema sp.]|jgi:translation initiation factor IF-2|nr:hypothetical protein [Treponema sp.]
MSDRGTGSEGAGVKALVKDGKAGTAAKAPWTGIGEAEIQANVLGHLLKIEADAAAMVDDAQAEADRRVAESEKLNRARYDEEYGREAAELDRAFDEEIIRIRADYQAQLEAYRKTLDSISVDQGRFSALMDKFLASSGAAAPAMDPGYPQDT